MRRRRVGSSVGGVVLLWSMVAPAPSIAATFVVTRTDDPTPDACLPEDCSLREAILAANIVDGSTVEIPAGHYRLEIPRDDPDDISPGDGTTGNLLIDAPMTLMGDGRDVTIIDARPAEGMDGVDRVMSANGRGDPILIRGVTITGGRKTGIFGGGGGIRIHGANLTLEDAAVTDNDSFDAAGGGLYVSTGLNTDLGKFVEGHLMVVRTIVRGNRALGLVQAGGILNNDAKLTIVDSTITENIAQSHGGGIVNIKGSPDEDRFGVLTITNSTISNNHTGLDEMGVETMFGGSAGGIQLQGGKLTFTNVTIVGNVAHKGQFGLAIGGGVQFLSRGPIPETGANFTNLTIAYNVGGTAGQVAIGSGAFAAAASIANTIIAGTGDSPNCSGNGFFESRGGNFNSDMSECDFLDPTDRNGVAPGLAAMLADNGGPTETLLLQPTSLAQGAGVAEICPATDQRGEPRGSPCDSGAVETDSGPAADAGAAVLALAAAALSGDPADLDAAEAALRAAIGA